MLNAEIVQSIISEYVNDKDSGTKIAKKYKIQKRKVYKILRENNVEIRNVSDSHQKFHCNDNYFNVIDTEEKAYFLGLLYADGCNNLKYSSVQIGLQERDLHILESFKKAIDSNATIWLRRLKDKNPNHSNCSYFRIFSKQMCSDLNKLGCFPKKSLILLFPTEEQVPRRLIHHFIRGFFDGDGSFPTWVSNNGYRQYKVCVTSTEMFCQELKKLTKELININWYIDINNKEKVNSCRNMVSSGYNQAYRFMDWIYQDATIFLKRKHDRYLEFKDKPNKRKSPSFWKPQRKRVVAA